MRDWPPPGGDAVDASSYAHCYAEALPSLRGPMPRGLGRITHHQDSAVPRVGAPHMHCIQRLLFRPFALVALLPLASCTLTDDFEPVRVTSPASPEDGLVEPSPAPSEAGAEAEARGEADLAGAAEVTRPSEAPVMVDIPLAPSAASGSSGVPSGDMAVQSGDTGVDAGVVSCVGCGERACSLDGGVSNGSC